MRAQGFDEVTGEGKISTGLDEDGDALGEADDEARNDGARAFDFDEVDASASQAWFGLWCGHARRIADFAPCGRRWILGRLRFFAGVVGVDEGVAFVAALGIDDEVVVEVGSIGVGAGARALVVGALPVDLEAVAVFAGEGFGFFFVLAYAAAAEGVDAFFAAIGLELEDVEDVVFAVAGAAVAYAEGVVMSTMSLLQ